MLRIVWSFLVEPPSHVPPEVRQRIRLLNSLLVLFLPIGLLVVAFRLLLTPDDVDTTFSMVFVGLVVVLVLYTSNRVGRYEITLYLVVALGFITIFLNAWLSDPPHVEIAYLIFLPLLSIILFSVFQTIVISFASLALLFAYIVLKTTMPESMIVDLVTFMALSITFIIFAGYQRTRLETHRQKLLVEKERTTVLNQLLSDMSHDLKTPVTVIKSSIYLLQKVSEPQKQQEIILRIKDQTAHLQRAIQDVLDISRLDDVSSLTLERVSLDALITDAVAPFQSIIEEKDIGLTLDLDGNLPRIIGNRPTLVRMIANLFENAVHYSASGAHITLRTWTHKTEIIFEVEDTGMGISAEDLPLIFDRFYRADKARSTSTGSMGLGLSIVKKAVEVHGGAICVESVLGKGTLFRVTLPLINRTN